MCVCAVRVWLRLHERMHTPSLEARQLQISHKSGYLMCLYAPPPPRAVLRSVRGCCVWPHAAPFIIPQPIFCFPCGSAAPPRCHTTHHCCAWGCCCCPAGLSEPGLASGHLRGQHTSSRAMPGAAVRGGGAGAHAPHAPTHALHLCLPFTPPCPPHVHSDTKRLPSQASHAPHTLPIRSCSPCPHAHSAPSPTLHTHPMPPPSTHACPAPPPPFKPAHAPPPPPPRLQPSCCCCCD